MVTKKEKPVKPNAHEVALPWQAAALAALLLLVVRMLYVQFVMPYGLGPDEAQYWHWTWQLDWSYLTKPPLTTAVIALTTQIWGDTMLGVKFAALAGQSAVALLGFGMAGMLAGVVAGWWAFGVLATVPLVAAGGLLMSPDALLLPLWMLGICIVFLMHKSNNLKYSYWVGLGVVIGLAGLAKYTAALFYPLLLVWALLARRDWLGKPQPYVAGLVSLLMQAPVLLWNWQHGWVGFEHLLWQSDGGGDTRHGGLATLGEFMGGQALVLGPVMLVLMVAAWGYGLIRFARLDARAKLLLVMTLPIFAVFAVQTLHAKVQPNWPVLGTVPALVLVAVLLASNWRRWAWLGVIGVVVNVGLSLVLHDTFILRDVGVNTRYKIDPTKDMRGWPEMGRMVGMLAAGLDNPVLLSTRYQTTAELAFHVPGQLLPSLYLNDGSRRANEYDLWAWPPLDNRLVLYVNEQNVLPPVVKARFGQCEPWRTLEVEQRGLNLRTLHTWLCWTSMAG